MAQTNEHIFRSVNREGDLEPSAGHKKRKRKGTLYIPTAYVNLGMYLALPLLLAILAGQYLDHRFQTHGKWTVVFLVFGTISVFYNLYRLYKQG